MSNLIYLPALRARDLTVRLTPRGDSFVVEPRAVLDANSALITKIKDFKDEILQELQSEAAQMQSQSQAACADLQDIQLLRIEHRFEPRPDLTEDSFAWRQLLRLALEHYPDIYAPLHGFRCRGSKMVRQMRRWHIEFDTAQSAVATGDDGAFRSKEEFDEAFVAYLRSNDDLISRAEAPINRLMVMLG